MYESNTIIGKNFECSLESGVTDFLHFSHSNGTEITLKNCQCNDFNEDGALVQKLKVHSTLDNYSASAELFQTIPFGSEFEVKRNFDFTDCFARVITDINPGIGAIEKLDLEDFEITGNFNKLQVFVLENNQVQLKIFELNDTAEVFQNGSQLILALNITTEDGAIFECGLGNDLWRHNAAAEIPDCDALFSIEGNQNKITFKRQILNFQNTEDAPKKRSWRFKYYFAWLDPQKKSRDRKYQKINLTQLIDENFSHVNSFADSPCMSSPLCRRVLRNYLRKTNDNIELEAVLSLCDDASHLERGGEKELLHWGIDDFLELMTWASRQLSKKDLAFKFALQDNLFASLAALQVLNKNLENCIETE